MPWYLNPLKVFGAARNVKNVASGGGPKSVRLNGVGNPRGVILPRVPISVQVRGRDGALTDFALELPVGLVFGYGYRVARWLHLPLVKDFDPKSMQGELKIPGR